MYETGIKLLRRQSLFDSHSRYEFLKRDGSGGTGGFSVDNLCKKLPDADLLEVDLRDNVSLTERGNDFAKWLIERGHKAEYFCCEFGSWGKPPPGFQQLFASKMMPPPETEPEAGAQ